MRFSHFFCLFSWLLPTFCFLGPFSGPFAFLGRFSWPLFVFAFWPFSGPFAFHFAFLLLLCFCFFLLSFSFFVVISLVVIVFKYIMSNQRHTINIHIGRKLSGKSRDEILEAVLNCFKDYNVHCVQQLFDLIRVTFDLEAAAVSALKDKAVRLFGIWCSMDGGPPTTIVHVFGYPYEEDEESVGDFFDTYGTVKSVRCQKYLSCSDMCTGTRLVDFILTEMPPRQVIIKGYVCHVWFKGQPLVCNLCSGKGHRAAECPNKDRCRLCGSRENLARNCPNPWNNHPRRDNISSDRVAVARCPRSWGLFSCSYS